jgi:hypothetical protein
MKTCIAEKPDPKLLVMQYYPVTELLTKTV